MVIVCSAYWAVISLMDTLKKKKRLRVKNETWGKLNEISEKLKVEKGLKTWKSLSNSNKKKRMLNKTNRSIKQVVGRMF